MRAPILALFVTGSLLGCQPTSPAGMSSASCNGKERVEERGDRQDIFGAICAAKAPGGEKVPVAGFVRGWEVKEVLPELPLLTPQNDRRSKWQKEKAAKEGFAPLRAALLGGCHEKIGFILQSSNPQHTIFIRQGAIQHRTYQLIPQGDRKSFITPLEKPKDAEVEWEAGVLEFFDRPAFERAYGPIRSREECQQAWMDQDDKASFNEVVYLGLYRGEPSVHEVRATRDASAFQALLPKLKDPPPLARSLHQRLRDARYVVEAAEMTASDPKLPRMATFQKRSSFPMPASGSVGMTKEYDAIVAKIAALHPDVDDAPLDKKLVVYDTRTLFNSGTIFMSILDRFVVGIAQHWLLEEMIHEADRIRVTRPFEAFALETIANHIPRVENLYPPAGLDDRIAEHGRALLAPLAPKMNVTGDPYHAPLYGTPNSFVLPLAHYVKKTPESTRTETIDVSFGPERCETKALKDMGYRDVTKTVTTPAPAPANTNNSAEIAALQSRLAEIDRERAIQQGRLEWKNAGEKAPVYDSKRCGGVGMAACPKTPEYQGGGPSGAQAWVHGDAEARLRTLDSERSQIEAKLRALGTAAAAPAPKAVTKTETTGKQFVVGEARATKVCTVKVTTKLPDGKELTRELWKHDASVDPNDYENTVRGVYTSFMTAKMDEVVAQLPKRDAREGAWAKRVFSLHSITFPADEAGPFGALYRQ